MGWTAQQTRVWMVRDRRGGWEEQKGRPEPADPDVAPPSDDDARELRMDRVAVLYGEITAATRAFLAAVAECDRHRDWEHAGFGSCAEWLAWRIGVTRNTANEKVRVARALEDLPLTSEAMARGELSFSKVRAVTRAAKPDTEAELLELARAGSAANLERVIRGWRTLDRTDEARRERALHRSRRFSVFPDQDGMYVVKGRLTPEVAAVLMRAVEAASDALFREAHKGEGEAPDPAQLRADAVGLVAQRALAAGFQGEDAPVSGNRAERYQVLLHVEETTLEQGTGAPREAGSGLSELEDGTRITAETARRLSCDAARVTVRTNADGTIIDAGRRTRTIPPATRRALEARDRGCRFPGCGLRFTDGHHIVHWADGGPTSLDNLVLLCERHHRRVHEERYQVCSGADGKIVFFTPTGRALYEAPPAPELPADPVQELVQGNRRAGGRQRAENMSSAERSASARRAATARWVRHRFGAPCFQQLGLPGADIVDAGLADLASGHVTPESLAVSLAAPRLRREGVPVGPVLQEPERRLWDLLSRSEGDLAHARYNAYLRRLVSFADACRLVRLDREKENR